MLLHSRESGGLVLPVPRDPALLDRLLLRDRIALLGGRHNRGVDDLPLIARKPSVPIPTKPPLVSEMMALPDSEMMSPPEAGRAGR
ncbi:hypothetical protein CHELA1G11_40033 [Hyphomicrobiales bacterium]|nr:hypothetical protein CHELA1G11_40033 [Hyphomicrobiales bacterium]CAH1696520.1 hypothetical protein CHELA1G2_40107 [Hyphomicrobiales bacterium]